jgi:hypothetical protein
VSVSDGVVVCFLRGPTTGEGSFVRPQPLSLCLKRIGWWHGVGPALYLTRPQFYAHQLASSTRICARATIALFAFVVIFFLFVVVCGCGAQPAAPDTVLR